MRKLKTTKKKTRNNVKDTVIDVLFWIAGSALYAVSVNIFTLPNNIAPGGVTGIATLLNYLFEFPIGITIIIINIPLFVLAFIFLGWKFTIKTSVATVMLSVLIDVIAPYIPSYTGDKILASLFGGLLSGAGLAFVFIRGATTGGADILAKLLRIRWPHLSMGRVILIIDFFVVVAAAIVYRNIENALYTIMVIFVSSRVIDYIIYGTGNGKLLMVVTKHAKEISGAVTEELKRGVTIIPVEGGYTGEEKNMLICAVRSNEVAKLNKLIRKHDKETFVIVTEAGEILGEGFKHENY